MTTKPKHIYIPVSADFYANNENMKSLYKNLEKRQIEHIHLCNVKQLIVFDDMQGMEKILGYIDLDDNFQIKDIIYNVFLQNKNKNIYRVTEFLKNMPESYAIEQLDKYLNDSFHSNLSFEFGFSKYEVSKGLQAINYDIRKSYELNNDNSEIPKNLLIRSLDYHYCTINYDVIKEALDCLISYDLDSFIALAGWFPFQYQCSRDIQRTIQTIKGWRKSNINRFYLRARRLKIKALKSLYNKIIDIQKKTNKQLNKSL